MIKEIIVASSVALNPSIQGNLDSKTISYSDQVFKQAERKYNPQYKENSFNLIQYLKDNLFYDGIQRPFRTLPIWPLNSMNPNTEIVEEKVPTSGYSEQKFDDNIKVIHNTPYHGMKSKTIGLKRAQKDIYDSKICFLR